VGDHVITRIAVHPGGPEHELLHVWNRGQLAGQLLLCVGDGARLAAHCGLVPESRG
jgi:hypothetical protein